VLVVSPAVDVAFGREAAGVLVAGDHGLERQIGFHRERLVGEVGDRITDLPSKAVTPTKGFVGARHRTGVGAASRQRLETQIARRRPDETGLLLVLPRSVAELRGLVPAPAIRRAVRREA